MTDNGIIVRDSALWTTKEFLVSHMSFFISDVHHHRGGLVNVRAKTYRK